MERNGSFENTRSISGFMKEEGIKTINLVKNPQTGKVFASLVKNNGSEITARVSEKVVSAGKLDASMSVSLFTPEDGDSSFMIHPTGERGANIITSFSLEANLQEA